MAKPRVAPSLGIGVKAPADLEMMEYPANARQPRAGARWRMLENLIQLEMIGDEESLLMLEFNRIQHS